MKTVKIIKVGNSWAVTIPPELARKYELELGMKVAPYSTDKGILYRPVPKSGKQAHVSPEFKRWLTTFKKKYGPALTELAEK